MKRYLFLICLVALVSVVLLSGCGPSDTTLLSDPNNDGTVINNGSVDIDKGSLGVGLFGGFVHRGFFGFNIAGLHGKTILEAKVSLYCSGSNMYPYNNANRLMLDHVDYGTLDATDFSLAAIEGHAPVAFSVAQNTGTRKELDVTSWVAYDVGREAQNSQFRLFFEKEGTELEGREDWYSGEMGLTHGSLLIVKYQ